MSRRKGIARFLVGAIRVIVPIAIILVGIAGLRMLIQSKSKVAKVERKPRPTYVQTSILRRQQHKKWITAYGSVQADQKVEIRPQVSGTVVYVHANLFKGGVIEKDETLLKIDPSDYETAESQAEAEVIKAEFELNVEEGNQVIAQREWSLLDNSIQTTEMGKQLALRKPHLKEKQAALGASRSRLRLANLNLARTEIRAPFNATIAEESIEIGQVVDTLTSVLTLVGSEQFQVQVSVPYRVLKDITFPNSKHELGAKTFIFQEFDQKESRTREGHVARFLIDVDPMGRMARVVVLVKDPLNLKDTSSNDTPLLVGSYVQVKIEGETMNSVFVIPRKGLREGNTLWIKNGENRLEIRQVTPVIREEDTVVVENGLVEGEELIISAIPAALPGMLVQVEEK